MIRQGIERIGGAATGIWSAALRTPKAAATVAAMILAVAAGGALQAQSSQTASKPGMNQNAPIANPQNVNVVNTPTVNVGTLPAVTLGGTPAVSITGTPSVNATVSNTTANPIPNEDVEKRARIPFSSIVSINGCSGSAACGSYIDGNPSGGAPMGYRLVVQHVSALLVLPAGTTAPPLLDLYAYNTNPKGHWIFTGRLGPTVGNMVYSGVNEDVVAYFDPGDGPGIDAYGAPGSREITVTGYLENCSVTGCPAIQN